MTKNLSSNSKKALSVFDLVMMTVISIVSIKNIPVSAQYGSSLLFYYLIAIFIFFIPSALIAAELATTWPHTGGVYIWAREAFGKRIAFLTAWLQWLYVIVWYPAILSFIAITISDLIAPAWAENKTYVLAAILTIFWFATFLNCKGLKVSSKISSICALIGVIVPMLFITALGIFWAWSGKPIHIDFSVQSMTQDLMNSDNLRRFITLMFSLMGMEIIAVHAGDVASPEKNYPKALIISSIIVLVTIIPPALAIAAVIPANQINLTKGVVDGFTIFLTAFHLTWLKPLIIMAIVIGGFGLFLVWLLSAARCLFVAVNDNCMPAFLQKTNQNDMPVGLFVFQGIIFTALSTAFILMPSVNSAFWLLTVSASQLALIYYLFLFASALRLRYKKPSVVRPFRVGKRPIMMWMICSVAMIICLFSIGFGFITPPEMADSKIFYQGFLITLILAGCGVAMIIYQLCQISFSKTLMLSDDGAES